MATKLFKLRDYLSPSKGKTKKKVALYAHKLAPRKWIVVVDHGKVRGRRQVWVWDKKEGFCVGQSVNQAVQRCGVRPPTFRTLKEARRVIVNAVK